MKFENQVAIISGGAGSGIGQATARALAEEGASIVIGDFHPRRTTTVASEIASAYNVRTLPVVCDVTSQAQVDNMVKETIQSFGRIDILINNAGTDFVVPVVDMTDGNWEQIINVNLRGVFYCTRAVLSTMINQKYGRIVNLSSVAAWTKAPDSAAYSAAKAGVAAFTKAVAREVAQYDILVNAVAPGVAYNPTITEKVVGQKGIEWMLQQIPLNRLGTPEDMANVIEFLVSKEASYITGECICVTGGWFAH